MNKQNRAGLSRLARLGLTALIQLSGNMLKILFELHYAVYPNKRYRIPPYSPPLLKTNKSIIIPRIVWQTNYTSNVTLPVYVNYLFNRLMLPQFEHYLELEDDCVRFIEENYPKSVLEAYRELDIGASKADLWRILKLFSKGGIYIDIDATIVFPTLSDFATDQKDLFLHDKKGIFTNHFIASAPHNEILKEIMEKILINIKAGIKDDVWNCTGPGVLRATESMRDANVDEILICCKQGIFTNRKFQYPDKSTRHWQEAKKK